MSDATGCDHPPASIEWRKWEAMGRPPRFQRQCLECCEGIGPRDADPLELPDEIDPGAVLFRKIARGERGRTGLGGRGNSKRREYEAYLRSAAWKGAKGVRRAVLIRDRNRCQECGARATCVAHLRYPARIADTRPTDCAASCDDCNASERRQRITRAVLGA